MSWLNVVSVIVHMLLSAAIIGLVLLQRGRGADAGAGFGSGASGTVFGARGSASFLSRTTAIFAALFFVSSLALTYLGGKQTAPTSVIDRVPQPANTNGAVPSSAPEIPSSAVQPPAAAPNPPADSGAPAK